MKRLLLFLAVALLSFPPQLMLPLLAEAGCRWETKEIKWVKTRYTNGSSTDPYLQDTTFAHIGSTGGLADTSGWFTLEGLCPEGVIMARQSDNPLGLADSAIVAIVSIVSDSTIAVTPNTTALTCVVQAGGPRASATGSNGIPINAISVAQASTAYTIATGDETAAIPIFTKTQVANVNLQYGTLAGQALRFIVASTTGTVGIPMCRIYVSYPVENSR